MRKLFLEVLCGVIAWLGLLASLPIESAPPKLSQAYFLFLPSYVPVLVPCMDSGRLILFGPVVCNILSTFYCCSHILLSKDIDRGMNEQIWRSGLAVTVT